MCCSLESEHVLYCGSAGLGLRAASPEAGWVTFHNPFHHFSLSFLSSKTVGLRYTESLILQSFRVYGSVNYFAQR